MLSLDVLSTESTLDLHLAQLDQLNNRSLVVAYSGGADSTALLHALSKQRHRFTNLRAIHINHHLQKASDDWARHCSIFTQELSVDLTICDADIQSENGPEADARNARYALFAEQLHAGELLLTAHHADDQLETLMLRLLKGTSVAAMAGIRRWRTFAAGALFRPLLDVKGDALKAYCLAHELSYVQDPSNDRVDLDRGWFRSVLRGPIEAFNPNAALAASRLAEQTAQLGLDQAPELPFDLVQWRERTDAKQRIELAALLSTQLRISQARIAQHQTELLNLDSDQQWRVEAKTGFFAVYRSQLHWVLFRDPPEPVQWSPDVDELDWFGRRLSREELPKALRNKTLTVDHIKSHEQVRIAAQRHRQRFKVWCQSHSIPPWERPYLPAIKFKDQWVYLLNYGQIYA